MANIAPNLQKLFDNANKTDIAFIDNNEEFSYLELLQAVENYTKDYQDLSGEVIILLADYGFSTVAKLLALANLNCIIVPLATDEINLDQKIKITRANHLITKDKITKLEQDNNYDLYLRLKEQKHSGLVLFSSGSTGEPKAMLHNFDNFIDNLKFQHNPYKVLNLYLFDHIAGLDVCLKALASSANQIIINNKSPKSIANTIKQYKIDILPAPPTMLNLLMLSNQIEDLQSLKMIIYGSEPINPVILENLKSKLKQVKLKNSFGTSESGAITSSSDEDGYLQLQVPYKIIDGKLFIKTKTTILGYLNSDEKFLEDGYLCTGDLVEIRQSTKGEGIKIIGREKQILNIGGQKLIPQVLENLILQMQIFKDCLIYTRETPLLGQILIAKVSLKKGVRLDNKVAKSKIREYLRSKVPRYWLPNIVEISEITINKRFKKSRQ